jgi:hypothetical protein
MEETEQEMEKLIDISIRSLKLLLCKEVAAIYAKFLWDFYQELQKAGFTKEEALKLVKVPPWKMGRG